MYVFRYGDLDRTIENHREIWKVERIEYNMNIFIYF